MATDENITYILEASAAREAPRMPSSQFRVAYVGIDQLTAVTVMGRVIAYYLPVSPAPRSAQVEQSTDGSSSDVGSFSRGPGLTEAPAGGVADPGASLSESSSTPTASRRRASRARASGTPAPTTVMPQPKIDAVLRKVNRVTGSER